MSKFDYIFKILLLGEPFVGKTSIVVRFIHNRFRKEYLTTVGMEPYSRYETIDGKRICYTIWDIAGANKFRQVLPMFYRSVQASLVVFDITERKSFEKTNKWVKDALKESPDQMFVLVGNKKDLDEYRVISKEEAHAKMEEIGAVEYIETSALTGDNVEDVFSMIGNSLLTEIANNQVE